MTLLDIVEPLIKGLQSLQSITQLGGPDAAIALALLDDIALAIPGLKTGAPLDTVAILARIDAVTAADKADDAKVDAEIAAEGSKPVV